MDTPSKLNTWKSAILGIGLDIDHKYGKQCVDVDLSWGQTLFPGIHYSVLFPPVSAAKDLFDHANTQYFDRSPNNHGDPNQLPQPGDIAVFAAAPEDGYTSKFPNPDGHTGVVDHADTGSVWLVQQDGSAKNPVVQLVQRPWRYTRCLGWLRPKLPHDIPPTATATGSPHDDRIGRTLYLHPVAQWSVYRRGQEPIRSKRIGYLIPKNYNHGINGAPGLTYQIVGVSQYPNTVSIVTDSYGLVDIYVDNDAEII
jgi:hypothetical protein